MIGVPVADRSANLANQIDQPERVIDITPTQCLVIYLVGCGWTNDEIAIETKIKIRSVQWHLRNILRELQASTKVAALTTLRVKGQWEEVTQQAKHHEKYPRDTESEDPETGDRRPRPKVVIADNLVDATLNAALQHLNAIRDLVNVARRYASGLPVTRSEADTAYRAVTPFLRDMEREAEIRRRFSTETADEGNV